jgi:hypothetical protein
MLEAVSTAGVLECGENRAFYHSVHMTMRTLLRATCV